MFCPKCSEPKVSDSTVFCTKCGLDLGELNSFVESGASGRGKSSDGIRHGFILLVIGVLLIPVWMFIGAAFPPADRFVEGSPSTTAAEAVAWILMWVAFLAGTARIAYAVAFERASKTRREEKGASTNDDAFRAELPAGDGFQPASAGKWKTTDELLDPILRKPKTSGEL